MPTTIPFALRLRLWRETPADITLRLTQFLIAWRLAHPKPGDISSDDDCDDDDNDCRTARPKPGQLSYEDTQKITRRVRRLSRACEDASGARQMRPGDLDRLRGIAGGVTLAGPASEHAADTLASRLHEEMPWHAPVVDWLWREMRVAARAGQGLRLRPLLMDGPPGIGKTHLALRLAELSSVPFGYIDVATASEGFGISGAQRTWSSSAPGTPAATILQTGIGNPLIFVDEIDKGGVSFRSSGTTTSAHQALLSLLEPASARVWECPYFGTTFDMSHVNWLLASNTSRRLPAPLQSRVQIVAMRHPTTAELMTFAAREVAQRGLDSGALDIVSAILRHADRCGTPVSLRRILRILGDLSMMAEGAGSGLEQGRHRFRGTYQ